MISDLQTLLNWYFLVNEVDPALYVHHDVQTVDHSVAWIFRFNSMTFYV